MNRVILIGRLANDPDMRYTNNGKPVCNFRLAVDRYGQEGTDFFPIVVWGKQAENCANYIGKGRLVAIDGRLQVRSWERDGQKKYLTEVIAQTVQFLDRGNGKATAVEPDDVPW